MDCESIRAMLDAYIDGELPEDEARALENHAQSCEACRQELEAAKLLREALAHMDEEIAVPLEAQAAWRSAVRAEAKRRGGRKWLRVAYAAAAALVLVVGGSLMLRTTPETAQPETALLMSREAQTADVIARDGGNTAEEARTGYAAWKKIAVEETEASIETLQALAVEYDGTCSVEDGDVCRIELPCENLEDFLNASSRMGDELDSETDVANADTAVVYIQICIK